MAIPNIFNIINTNIDDINGLRCELLYETFSMSLRPTEYETELSFDHSEYKILVVIFATKVTEVKESDPNGGSVAITRYAAEYYDSCMIINDSSLGNVQTLRSEECTPGAYRQIAITADGIVVYPCPNSLQSAFVIPYRIYGIR